MNPMLLANVVQAGMGLGQTFWGLTGGPKRPKYEIPESARAALNAAKIRSFDKETPGASAARDQVNLAASNQLAAAAQAGNVQESVASIASQQEKGMRNVNTMVAEQNRKDDAELQQLLMEMSSREDLAFQMNEFAPYAEKAQQKKQMFGAGMQNILGALNNFGMNGTSFGGGFGPGTSNGGDLGSSVSGWAGGDVGGSPTVINNSSGLFGNFFSNLFGRK